MGKTSERILLLRVMKDEALRLAASCRAVGVLPNSTMVQSMLYTRYGVVVHTRSIHRWLADRGMRSSRGRPRNEV